MNWLKRLFGKSRPIKYRLEEDDYLHLILGGELRIRSSGQDCHLIMADIGYDRQIAMINQAIGMIPENRYCEIRSVKA